jgi:hypothetical protein
VFGLCKSAGTLAALGADQIIMGEAGELGPLDVQLYKPDEIMPTASGLDILTALAVIKNSAFSTFEDYMVNIVGRSQGNITAKTASDIAASLAVGLFAPMMGQVDPERLGEIQRAINIATAYGTRLDRGNLKSGALDKLVQGYPAHGFVVDYEEAKTIFKKVRMADTLEAAIAIELLPWLKRQSNPPAIVDLIFSFTSPPSPSKGSSNATRTKNSSRAKQRPAADKSVAAAGNVAPLRRNVSSGSSSAKKDDNTSDH